MTTSIRSPLVRWVVGMGLLAAAAFAWAQGDELPGRVGRLAEVEGRVWLYDQEQGQWVEAMRNRSLTSGDRLSTERGARAQVRIGSTDLRLGADSELDFDRIDDERMVFALANGSLALRVRSRDIAREVEVRAGGVRVLPERAGHYRIDRDDDTVWASAWRGALRVDTRDQQVQVVAGRRVELQRDGRDGATIVSWSAPEADAFADWVARDEVVDERSSPRAYVSPEMTGVEDLERYGRWERHPDYGMVWFPLEVAVGWAPYRYGRWVWQVRWGWTWVDDAPWGFAPFHYGRWLFWGGRWVWWPGAYVARPAYSPGLVAWIGGTGVGVSITIGGHSGPPVGWVPLAPRDVYVPPFRYGPRYYERVNKPHLPHVPPQVPTGPIMYGNRGVPDAVTVVPADVLRQRQPVAPSVVRDRDVQRAIERDRFRSEAPVGGAPSRVVPVPGGAEPARIPAAPGREARQPDRGGVIDLRRERPVPQVQPPVQPAPPVQPGTPPRPPQADRPQRPERQDRPDRPDRPDRSLQRESEARPDWRDRPLPAERAAPVERAVPSERVAPVERTAPVFERGSVIERRAPPSGERSPGAERPVPMPMPAPAPGGRDLRPQQADRPTARPESRPDSRPDRPASGQPPAREERKDQRDRQNAQ